MRKLTIKITLVLTLVLMVFVLCPSVEAVYIDIDKNVVGEDISYDLSSNFFVQDDDLTQVPTMDFETMKAGTKSEEYNYRLVASNEEIELYLIEETLNIAVKVIDTGYIFYTNPNRYQFDISYFYATGELTDVNPDIPTSGTYSYQPETGNKALSTKPKLSFTYNSKGFKCHFNYEYLAISYNLYVSIDGGKILVEVPEDEIVEDVYTYTKTTYIYDANGNMIREEDGSFAKELKTFSFTYYLKTLTFFEDFGYTYLTSDNKWMNGYTFLPDGSGALIRYQNEKVYKDTAYIKRVYGDDAGIDDVISTSSEHLKEDSILTLPIFGIVHGYNQNAFLTVITEGDSLAQLNSTPYGYGSRKFESTYYTFIFRDRYNVKAATSTSGYMSSSSEERYAGGISYSYNFLKGTNANYNGMADLYESEYLSFLNDKEVSTKGETTLNLNVLAQDYKKGLFGKNFQEMTTYSELLAIIKDLSNLGVYDFNVSYIGMFRGGFYNNDNYKPRISYNLGSRQKLLELTNYFSSNDYDLSNYIDPTTTFNDGKSGIVKKINLSNYSKDTLSYLFDEAYQMQYTRLSDSILKYVKRYDKFNIDSLNLVNLGSNLTSYRYKSVNYSREETKEILINELKEVSESFNIGLSKANSYTYEYLSKYYDMYTESSSYTFITDCVPFISLLLSGHVELYGEEINFIDDYNRYALRLIEYNIYPTFIITDEDSSILRYTNYEYLYTSEYSRWKDVIVLMYSTVNSVLKEVTGETMISHNYLASGVAITTYSNNKSIIVNYSDNDYVLDSVTIESHSAEVIE